MLVFFFCRVLHLVLHVLAKIGAVNLQIHYWQSWSKYVDTLSFHHLLHQTFPTQNIRQKAVLTWYDFVIWKLHDNIRISYFFSSSSSLVARIIMAGRSTRNCYYRAACLAESYQYIMFLLYFTEYTSCRKMVSSCWCVACMFGWCVADLG